MNQGLADYRVFWQEFRRTFHTTGAVLPSGPGLAAALARHVRDGARSGGPRRILEVGPGTGAVTLAIARAMRDGDQLELVEKNGEFVARLKDKFVREDPYRAMGERIALHHAGVDELAEDRPYDVIVSGLPLNNFPVALVEQILAKLQRLMAPGGVLSFFEYIAIRRVKASLSRQAERERLRAIGKVLDNFLSEREIGRDRVLANVPPAWVHHVRAGGSGLGTGDSGADKP